MATARSAFSWMHAGILVVFGYSVQINGLDRVGTKPASHQSDAGSALSSDDPTPRLGYLLNLVVQGGKLQLVSAAEIDNYFLNKHLDAEDDWFLILLNENGQKVGTSRIRNPGRLSPLVSEGQILPLTVKVPQVLHLKTVVIVNQYGRELLRIPVNDTFKAQATAIRREFLIHDRENRSLLAQGPPLRRAARVESGDGLARQPPFETLPEELQTKFREEFFYQIEKLEEFDPAIVDVHGSIGVEPEELLRGTPPSEGLPTAPAFAKEPSRAAGAFALSGQVTDLDTGAPLAGAILDFYQYDPSGKYVGYIGRVTTDFSGNYSTSADAGSVNIVPDFSPIPGKRYVRRNEYFAVTGNTVWNFRAIPAVLLSGTVANSSGQGVSGVTIALYSRRLRLTLTVASGTRGAYSILVPGNYPLDISLSPPLPYTSPPAEMGLVFEADTVKDFEVETGWLISGTVTDESGRPIAKATVLVRQLNVTTTTCPYWSGSTDASGNFALSVRKDLEPRTFVIAAYATGYLLQSASLDLSKHVNQNFTLPRGNTVSGAVRDGSEKALTGARVRAYQRGLLVTSALTRNDGTYSFDLAPGVYELEATPPAGSSLGPATVRNVSVERPLSMNFVLPRAAGTVVIRLYFPDQDTYNRFAVRAYARFELSQMGLNVLATSGVQGAGGFDESRGKYYRSYSIYVDSGRYSLKALLMGCQPLTRSDIEVAGAVSLSIDVPVPYRWRGVLRGADTAPLANLNIQSYNDLTTVYELSTTNAHGQFDIFLTPGGFAKFFTDTATRNIVHTERFENVTTGRNQDCVLNEFPPFADSGAPLTQIYGVSDRASRWNIVMIGDGYTSLKETFTDTNGSGQWDGVLYYDLSRNSVWDLGEPYRRYGNAAAPVAGADPTLRNEPFVDLNGDGVPNLRDQELFDTNTLDTARSLFGQDQWWQHRAAFNIFRIRLVSNQSGHKLIGAGGSVVLDRDTALGTYLNTPERSWLFNANYTLISQYINHYVPECDTRIVMVNQPIRMGRVNSYMFQYGGELPTLGNDYVVAHEMGHNVGLLADEYTEYQETFKGAESASCNITALTKRDRIPWKHFIDAGKEIPSVPGSSGVGLYEGGGYYTGGRYRPTEHCMMVSGNRYCPVCTEQIELRLREITAEVPDPVLILPSQSVSGLHAVFSWSPLSGVSHYLFELERADGTQLIASYDVYNSSLTLPFVLASGGEYRWRIRAGSTGRWGAWSSWVYFRQQNQTPAFTSAFAHLAAGGGFQTTLIGVNAGRSAAQVFISPTKSDGTPLDLMASGLSNPAILSISPMGSARVQANLLGNTVAGYARLDSSAQIDGTAIFQILSGDLVQSEAAVALAKPRKSFTVYVDYFNDAVSGYAIANVSESPANLTLTLRDLAGNTRDVRQLTIAAGRHIPEFTHQRFPGVQGGFEGSLEIVSDQYIVAVALRFDNPASDVFSTIPVVADEPGTTLVFPQVADGGGYRTNFILINPAGAPTSATLEFFSGDGAPLALPIDGVPRTTHSVPLGARGVSRFVTDGGSTDPRVGWAKVTSTVAIAGSAIFQTRSGSRILSEAGVASSPLLQDLVTSVESSASTQSGLAICNPNAAAAALTLILRNSSGETAASTNITLPANGHVAKFFTEWFPRGFGEFQGTLEVRAPVAVSAVALRFDNPQLNVFAALPVIRVP